MDFYMVMGRPGMERELLRERELWFRYPGAHRPWHQVRPEHWHLRHGLLHGDGQAWHECSSQASQDRQGWLPSQAEQGGCYEVVPDQVRRYYPQQQEVNVWRS